MSGNDNKTTSVTNTDPPEWAEPGLKYVGSQALSAAKKGNLAQPLTMSTVVPFSQQTTQGMNSIMGNANEALSPGGYSDQFKGIIGSGGYNQEQQDALSGIRSTATSPFDINANPAFQQVLQRAQGDAANAVNSSVSGMGRYGSGAHQGVLSREIGDLTSRMVGDEYRNWQGRQDQAQQQLFNAGQQGQGNMQNAFERVNDPAQAMMGVGGMFEDLYGRQLNDSLRIADETQNQERNNLRELAALLGGAGQFANTTQTSQGPSNTMSNIFGGLLGGASLLGL